MYITTHHQILETDCNTPDETLFEHARHAITLGLPVVRMEEAHQVPAIMVGGGPSAGDKEQLDAIRLLQANGGKIFALNNAAAMLRSQGITPDFQILIDARESNKRFVADGNAEHILIASQCHPTTFEAAMKSPSKVSVYHPLITGLEAIVGKDQCFIGGGTTVGLTGMCLVFAMGYRKYHVFGFDCCNRGQATHAYLQPENEGQETLQVAVNNRVFSASLTMVSQLEKFQVLAPHLTELGCHIELYGDGLLQHVYKTTREDLNQKVLTAVYDFGSSPPSYDFVSFLTEAEEARKEGGYSKMDIVFQPGPMFGFRADELPPDPQTRRSLLESVCVPLCWRVPSVRSVSVQRHRSAVAGDVFPKDWKPDQQVSHYGTAFLPNKPPMFEASEGARKWRDQLTEGSKYATITIRQASYWPERNSDLKAWREIAEEIQSMGLPVVVIPDTENPKERLDFCIGAPEAAFDVDKKIALYEDAEVNFGVTNGPAALMYLVKAPYVVFMPVIESIRATSTEFYAANNFPVGSQMNDRGVIIWSRENVEKAIEAASAFITQPLEEQYGTA